MNNNQIANVDTTMFDVMDEHSLQVYGELILQKRFTKMQERIEMLEDQLVKKEKKDDIRFKELEQKQQLQADMSVNALRAKEAKTGWVNQRDFGLLFNVTISSTRVGRLLRVAGIAQRTNKTVPRREYVGDGRLASISTNSDYSTTLWNFRRCMTHIDLWLEKHGHYYEFYSIDNEDEMARFIDHMHNKYVGDLKRGRQ